MKNHVKIRGDENCSLRNVFTPFLNGFFPHTLFPKIFANRSRVIWWIAALSSWRHYLYHRHCYATVLYHTNSMTSLVEHSVLFLSEVVRLNFGGLQTRKLCQYAVLLSRQHRTLICQQNTDFCLKVWSNNQIMF